jgi:hypothetical protein
VRDCEGEVVTTRTKAKAPAKGAKPTRKPGRPASCTQAVRDRICAHIIAGMSVRQICALPGMPSMATVFRSLAADREFQQQYARSRTAQMDLMAEEILDIADDGRNDWIERENRNGGTYIALNDEAIARSRVRIDARKWLMSKLAPKRYGERLTTEVSGPDAGPIETARNGIPPGVDAAMEIALRRIAEACAVESAPSPGTDSDV